MATRMKADNSCGDLPAAEMAQRREQGRCGRTVDLAPVTRIRTSHMLPGIVLSPGTGQFPGGPDES